MAEQSREDRMAALTGQLKKEFQRWDQLYHNGGYDPFWADGMNLNLVRNHIMGTKEAIEQVMKEESEELSLFAVSYPDIYYRATPDEVPYDYMAKADEIRQRAAQQLALYEKDPNFQFILENHDKVFPKGETKATKAAGLYIGATASISGYRRIFESGDLVDMRRAFYGPYEENAKRWAEWAGKLKAFLETEHDPADNIVIKSDYDDYEDVSEEVIEDEERFEPAPPKKLSLDKQIQGARDRKSAQPEVSKPRQEQMTLF